MMMGIGIARLSLWEVDHRGGRYCAWLCLGVISGGCGKVNRYQVAD